MFEQSRSGAWNAEQICAAQLPFDSRLNSSGGWYIVGSEGNPLECGCESKAWALRRARKPLLQRILGVHPIASFYAEIVDNCILA